MEVEETCKISALSQLLERGCASMPLSPHKHLSQYSRVRVRKRKARLGALQVIQPYDRKPGISMGRFMPADPDQRICSMPLSSLGPKWGALLMSSFREL